MPDLDRRRVKALEKKLGHQVPDEFLAFLVNHQPIDEGGFGFWFDSRLWEIRTTYSLDRSRHEQLDSLYHRVGNAVPRGALPFAQDWGGDLFCLMLSGPHRGKVVYWTHERDAADHSVKPIANSVEAFVQALIPVENE